MNIYRFGALLLALFLATGSLQAASAPRPKPTTPKAEDDVTAEWSNGGWRVHRLAGSEEKVTLKLKSDQQVRSIAGEKFGKHWVFWVASEKPKDEASVELEFVLETKLKNGKVDLTTFAQKVSDEVFATYTEQFNTQNDLSIEAKRESAAQLAGSKVNELMAAKPLSDLTIDGSPAAEQVLLRMGFRKDDQGHWEVSERALETLRQILEYKMVQWTQTQLFATAPDLPCVKVKDFESQLNACATELRKLLDQMPPPRLAEADKFLADTEIEAGQAWTVAVDLTVTAKEPPGLAKGYEYWIELAKKLEDQDKVDPKVLQHAGALIWIVQRAYWNQNANQLKEQLAKMLIDGAKLARLTVDKRTKDTANITIVPGNPRFFFSTGPVFMFLDDRVKMGLPLMASICASMNGCDSDGLFGGASPASGQVISLDVGVNATTFGKSEPRLGKPTFLVGGGVNLVYAAHASVGAALFENPQSGRTNAALYLSLTLDLVDGKDILGGLGVSKPQVQVNKP